MLKAGTFLLGITSGVYLGMYLREQGYTAGLTRAYYAFKNGEENKLNTPAREKTTLDDLFQMYNAGLLQGDQLEKFKEIVKTKRYDKVDEIVIKDMDKIFDLPEYADIKRKYNNRVYDK